MKKPQLPPDFLNYLDDSMSEFQKKCYIALGFVAPGQVATYGQIAEIIDKPKAPRAVGGAMHNNPCAPNIPCHRVVESNGRLGGFASGKNVKISRLRAEGVAIENAKVADFENKRLNDFDIQQIKSAYQAVRKT